MVSHEQKIVAVYVRVSTDKQMDGFGIDLQIQKCQKLSQYNKWKIYRIYRDEGYSGSLGLDKRQGLRQLMDDARDGRFDTVLCYSLDRIGRSTKIILDIAEKLQKLEVGLYSCRETFDTTSHTGKLMLTILSAISEHDKSKIKERMKSGAESKKAKTGVTSGPPPYGYKKNKSKVFVDDDKAPTVRHIFTLRSQDKSYQEIADIINGEGYRTRTGKDWSVYTVRNIIRHEDKYRGGYMNGSQIKWPIIVGPEDSIGNDDNDF